MDRKKELKSRCPYKKAPSKSIYKIHTEKRNNREKTDNNNRSPITHLRSNQNIPYKSLPHDKQKKSQASSSDLPKTETKKKHTFKKMQIKKKKKKD